MSTELIIGIVAVVLLMLLFNTLIAKKNQVKNAFASIDVYLKKRYDLIPNLVASIENYMNYEIKILTEITQLRTKGLEKNISNEEKIEINDKLTSALHQINVAVENYPQIKTSENFLQLQASLNEIEEQLSASRRTYNSAVNSYNNAIQMFPTIILAKIMGYKEKQYFEASAAESQNININNLFNKE